MRTDRSPPGPSCVVIGLGVHGERAASLRAEGLTVAADVEAITTRWARGEIGTAQMRELVRGLYGVRRLSIRTSSGVLRNRLGIFDPRVPRRG